MHLVSDKTQLVNRWAVEDAGKLAKTATQNPSLAIGHARFCLDVNREFVRQLAYYVYQCIIMVPYASLDLAGLHRELTTVIEIDQC